MRFERETPVRVFFEGEFAGRFYADFMCEKTVVLEVKAGKSLAEEHELQVKGYQLLSKKPVALLLNLGPLKVEIHRRVESRFEQSA